MSKTSHVSSSRLLKHFTLTAASLVTAAGLLALAQSKHVSPHATHAPALLLPTAPRVSPKANEYWHTEGADILDEHNRRMRIAGVNWSGFETKEAVPGGLDVQDYRAILQTIKDNGFNTVRLPLSNEMVETPVVPTHIRFHNTEGPINAELQDLTSIEILDRIVNYAGEIGLKIILDNHRSEAGSSAEENGLWYTAEYPETSWVNDWQALASRYVGNPTVIGMDLRNEPHNADKGGACWDCGGARDWHLAAARAGNSILGVNPHLLIFVEGVDSYAGDTAWWGGNLAGVQHSPVHLSQPGHLVYSAHEYGPAEYNQPWFNMSTRPATLAALWHHRWSFISEAAIAPVWIGEFGTPNGDADVQSSTPGSEGQWFSALVEFLQHQSNLSWTYWGINGEDRYGLLTPGYAAKPLNEAKINALLQINVRATEQALRRSNAASREKDGSQRVGAAVSSLGPAYRSEASMPTTTTPVVQEKGQTFPVSTSSVNSREIEPNVDSAIAENIRQAVRIANRGLVEDEGDSQR